MKYFFLMIFTFFSLTCFAQTADDTKSINANIITIKRDNTYLYGEATKAEVGEALSAAKSNLEIRVSEWVSDIHASEGIEGCIAKAKEHSSEIQTMRGSLFRVLVYVKKSDILPVSNKSEVVVIKVNSQKAESEPVVKKPLVVENEVVSDVKPETSSTPNEIQKRSFTAKARPDLKLTNEERKMVAITNKNDLEFYLKSLNGMGKIKKGKAGKLATLPENEDCHLFIYNKQKGNVLTVLRKEGSTFLNLRESTNDNVNNYKDCEVLWFQLR